MFSSIRQKRFFLITCYHWCIRKGTWYCVMFKVFSNQWGNNSNIVMLKSRIAPLKSTRIPRLELCGAVLRLNLAKSIANILMVDMREITFWTDNMNVLYWIHNQSRLFKSFMANWIGEIQTRTKPSQWRYASTKFNPADKITRAMTVKDIASSNSCWSGSELLGTTEDKWSKKQISSTLSLFLS